MVSLQSQADIDAECLAVEQAFASNNLEQLESLQLVQPRWQAQQQFRLVATYIPMDDKKSARKAIKAGLKIVTTQLKQNPNDVSMLLLGAMLNGQYLLLSPWRFFLNGRRGLKQLAKAEGIAPDNPRAVLIRGTAKVILPGFIGGNSLEAVQMFQQSLANSNPSLNTTFENQPLCQAGEWAQVDLLNWLGRAEQNLGNEEAAADAYRRALLVSPQNHWVKLAIEGEGYEWTDAPTELN